MKVGLDGTPLAISSGGLRRYTEELFGALCSEFPGDRYSIIPPRPGRWWLAGVQLEMRRQACDVFHGTNFEVPVLPLRPSVMTIQDLSPWMDARWHSHAGRVKKRTAMLLRFRVPTMVITPTEVVRRQAMERFGLAGERVVAVPDAASDRFRPVAGKPPKPYFIFVGTIEPRKNLRFLIDAWSGIGGAELWIAGRRRDDAETFASKPGLRWLGEVTDDELPALYSNAIACVYPSLYEGFGLPVLEAMQCGAAVIASKDPALVEVSGGAAIHVAADDVEGWRAAMRRMLGDANERETRRSESIRRAAAFSWRKTAQMTREVYAEAIRHFRS